MPAPHPRLTASRREAITFYLAISPWLIGFLTFTLIPMAISLYLGFTRWDLFSVIGLHSPAVLQGDASQVDGWIAGIPSASRPSLFMDIGENDQELMLAREVEAQFTENGLAHEWRLYSGAHTEEYWSAHVGEYIRWYAEQWATP